MSSQRWLALIAVAVFGLTACPPPAERPAEEPPPAPEVTPEPMVQQEIAVMNATTEPVTVRATIEGREQNLGVVQPNDSATFTVSAARGSNIEVQAMDPAGEVVERESVQVTEMRRDWRLLPRTQPGTGPGTQPAQPGTGTGTAPGQP